MKNPFKLENITSIPSYNYSKTESMIISDSENLISLEGIPENITELILDNVNFSVLKELPILPSIKNLKLHNCTLKELPIELIECTNLESIEFQQCSKIQWKKVLPLLAKITSLKKLYLEQIRNTKIPEEFILLQQIESLYFGENLKKRFSWEEYFELVQQLPKLKHFSASSSHVNIPISIKEIGHLHSLTLDSFINFFPLECIGIKTKIKGCYESEKINKINANNQLSLNQKQQLFAFTIEPSFINTCFPNLISSKNDDKKWNVYLPKKIQGFTIKDLNDLFKEKYISFSTKLSENTSHIILSSKLSENKFTDFVTSNKYQFLLEDDLKNSHWEKETPFLMVQDNQETAESFNEQILTLLANSDEDNCLLALSIMENGGVNSYFIQHVLGLKLFHPSVKVRKLSDKIFQKYASTSLKNLVGKKTFLTRSVKPQAMAFLLDSEEINKGEFIAIFYNIIGNNPIHRCSKGYFSFEKQDITEIPLCLHYWTNQILYLNLNHNNQLNFDHLIDFLTEKHSNILMLELNHNDLKISEKISKLHHLNYLELKNNQIDNLNIFKKLDQLIKLDISKCKINNIDIESSFPDKIEELNLSYNKLVTIPIFSENSKLRTLNLSHNLLTEMPKELGVFSRLWSLNLSYNQLTEVNINIRLHSLSRLEIKKNLLKEFTLSNQFKNLSYLHLSENKIEKFIIENNESSLFEIILSNNNLTEIPYELSLANKNIYLADFSNNQIKELTTKIFNIGRTVKLNNNLIEELPERFSERVTKNNQRFYLKNNPLKISPKSTGNIYL